MLPFLLKPYLKKVLWGGSYIAEFKGMDTSLDHVGESWEVSAMPGCESVAETGPWAGKNLAELCRELGPELIGTRIYEKYGGEFPILIKYLDAVDDLSVQVHPGDDLAYPRHGCRGKSEMWYVVRSAPGAKLSLGLTREISADEFERRVADHSLSDVLATYPTNPGDVFYLPPGRIHALGAGNFVAEVQLASDITYRIHDYGRRDKDGKLRELHIAQARDAIDFGVLPDYRSYPRGETQVSTPFFRVDKIELGAGVVRTVESPDFSVVMCIDGNVLASAADGDVPVGRGHTLFIPANTKVNLTGDATILLVVP